MRLLIFKLLSIVLSIVVCAFALEVFFRFLPVNEGLRAQAVTAEAPVFRFDANRSSTYSAHWNFDIVNRVRTNNFGFVSDFDYQPEQTSPLFAIVGDSYIEAAMVPFTETVAGRLAKTVGDRGRVYAFAASGAGLAQYLSWAEFARDTFKPNAFLFSIIGNDFSEALYSREQSPGFPAFEKLPDGTAVSRLTEYRPSLLRRIVRSSSLAMYLIANLKVQAGLQIPLFGASDGDVRFVASTAASEPEEYLRDASWAVDVFLDRLPASTGVPYGRIVLSVDGFCLQMYDPDLMPEVRGSAWDVTRQYLIDNARRRGVEVIDLHPVFSESFARSHLRFEFPTDTHWNSAGHGAVADAVKESAVFKTVFAR